MIKKQSRRSAFFMRIKSRRRMKSAFGGLLEDSSLKLRMTGDTRQSLDDIPSDGRMIYTPLRDGSGFVRHRRGHPRAERRIWTKKMQSAKLIFNFPFSIFNFSPVSSSSGAKDLDEENAKCKINFQLSIFNFPFLNFFAKAQNDGKRNASNL